MSAVARALILLSVEACESPPADSLLSCTRVICATIVYKLEADTHVKCTVV